jgi:hypothetical protein
MFNLLAADYTSTKVRTATQQLKSTSTPGPDSFSAMFYHNYWDIIGNDILNYTLMILNQGFKPDQINDTFIFLIPKISNPSSPLEFRPISLCNVILKIVTKTIANRIKHILPKIIKEAQSGFLTRKTYH